MPAPEPGIRVSHTNGTVPWTIPTSASDVRHADVTPRRCHASAHTTSAARGSATTVMSTTPFSVSRQPCHRPAMHTGAAIRSGPRTT